MLICYHKDCFDGMAAAMVAKMANPEARLLACEYSSNAPLPSYDYDEIVCVVDFSFSGHLLCTHFSKALKVVIIDHHEGAINQLNEYFRTHAVPDNIELVLDTSKSGALLTWDYFNPKVPAPFMIEHVSDRDLWLFKNENTKAYIEALGMEPMTIEAYEAFLYKPYDEILIEGNILLKKRDALIKWHLENNLTMVEFEGYTVPCINAPRYIVSDLADALFEQSLIDAPFVMLYYDIGAMRRYSLRSTNDRTAVHTIAQRYGGNGHRNAAGFKQPANKAILTHL